MKIVTKIAHIGYKLRAFAVVAVCIKILRGDVITNHSAKVTHTHILTLDPEILEIFNSQKVKDAYNNLNNLGSNMVNAIEAISNDVKNDNVSAISLIQRLFTICKNVAQNDDRIPMLANKFSSLLNSVSES